MPVALVTHWCDWDEPGRRWVRTLCRTFIHRREHSNTPTCPICREVLAAREKQVAHLGPDETPF